MPAPVTKLVIERDRWCRGGGDDTALLVADGPRRGTMCCLGFFGQACGIEASSLLNKKAPGSVHSAAWPEWLVQRRDGETGVYQQNTQVGTDLVGFNDSESVDDQERESRITEIFAKHGVTVEFRGDTSSTSCGTRWSGGAATQHPLTTRTMGPAVLSCARAGWGRRDSGAFWPTWVSARTA